MAGPTGRNITLLTQLKNWVEMGQLDVLRSSLLCKRVWSTCNMLIIQTEFCTLRARTSTEIFLLLWFKPRRGWWSGSLSTVQATPMFNFSLDSRLHYIRLLLGNGLAGILPDLWTLTVSLFYRRNQGVVTYLLKCTRVNCFDGTDSSTGRSVALASSKLLAYE